MRLRSTLPASMIEIEETAMQLAALVEMQLGRALQGKTWEDRRLTENIVACDSVVDELRDKVKALVLQSIEHWAPVGVVLRRLLMFHQVADELERIGDYAVHLARYLEGQGPFLPLTLYGDLLMMGKEVRQQYQVGVLALAHCDGDAAYSLGRIDVDLDQQKILLVEDLQRMMIAQPDHIARIVPLLFAVRDLERIGDRVVNIGEDLLFVLVGTQLHLN